ncbi:MAG: L-2-hydroxyglutarate oxidase [SAR324 cluster bacterium]|nr:L-2-hydroxyglutarate oxidase [SAR324 cluster bacterium]MBL7035523.1 L-2-hydroxyglutarate oxidase [SAR324 cluster bacterium]
MQQSDIIIIGGGIVGLATAYQFSLDYPRLKITLLEKEPKLAIHQTGHNSGVLHTGIYYKPGSLKALNCREGKSRMEDFCRDAGIAYEICGKVIVAVSDNELPALETIYQRGRINGVRCEIIGKEKLHELEPHVAGIQAVHVPEAGIVDYGEVCRHFAEQLRKKGDNSIHCSAKVLGIRQAAQLVVETEQGEFGSKYLVNCAGLYSDKITAMTQTPESKIIPFRGEYYEVCPEKKYLCRNLIYPVPDPNFPFLGVHFTRMIDGTLECGPNAVLAFAREGYTRSTVNVLELAEVLSYPGFLKLAAKYWRAGAGEMWRSFSKAAFVKALQRLIPEISAADLAVAPAGIRAQAVLSNGKLVDDFLIQENKNIINVGNAPSPAATSSLNIGRHIVETVAKRF